MRTNREFTFRENASAIKKLFLNKVALLYFRLFKPQEIWLIRDGGIGDAIMATTSITAFKNLYPNTKINLVTNTPSIFENLDLQIVVASKFPRFWLTYGHYDLPWMKNKRKHIKIIMGESLGLKIKESDDYRLDFKDDKLLNELSILPNSYIVIQPESSQWFKEKNWCVDNWANLVNHLNEKEIAVHQIGILHDELIKGCIDWRGKLTLAQSINLIQFSNLLIGVNSFGEQVAAAFNVPSIILYGPTNPAFSLNSGQIAICAFGAFDYESLKSFQYEFSSLNDISVDQLMSQVGTLLNLKK
jgi:ADP-heptose:LPS heptosyltransferase